MFGANRTTFGGNTSQPFNANASPFGSQQSANNSFGMSQQTNTQPSYGGFGSNNTVPNSTFGLNTNTNTNTGNTLSGGMFGQSSNNPIGSNSMFGANNTTTANGMNNSMMGNNMNQRGQGTGIKPFVAFQEKDPTTNATNVFQSITCMPEYANFSFEELRYQDYQAGRKFANSQVPTTNNMGSFGLGMNNTTSNATGSNMFGSNNAANTSSDGLFGQKLNTGFASNTTSGLFGSTNTNALGNTTNNTSINSPFGMKPQGTAGLFGQQNNTANSPFGQQQNSTGLFGQQSNSFGMNRNTTTTSGGLFGQPNNNTFGQANANTSGGLFGQNNNQPQQQPQQQQSGLFGQTPSTGGFFGQTQNNSNTFGQSNANASGGLFGQNNNQQQKNGLFGQNTSGNVNTNTSMFGSNTGFGGQQNAMGGFNQNQATGGMFGNKSAGGLFGQNNNQQPQQPQQQGGLFGNKPSAGGLFGQNNQQQSAGILSGQNNTQLQQQQGGLFGQNNQQQNSMGGGLFGQNNTQQQSSGIFGAKPAGATTGGLVGNNGQQLGTAGGLFGAKPAAPATGGLFGNNNTTSTTGGLFGNNNNNNMNTLGGQSTLGGTSGGGLFGAKSTAPAAGGLFGNNNNNTLGSNTGGGLFGAKPMTTGSTLGGGLFGNNNNNSAAATGGLFANNMNQQGATLGTKPMMGNQSTLGQQGQQTGQQPGLVVNNPFGSNNLFTKIALDENGLGSTKNANIAKINADIKKNTSLSGAYKLVPKPLFSVKNHIHTANNSTTGKILPAKDKKQYILKNVSESSSSPKLLGDLPISTIANKEINDNILLSETLLFNPEKKSFKDLILQKQKIKNQDAEIEKVAVEKKSPVPAPVLKESNKENIPAGKSNRLKMVGDKMKTETPSIKTQDIARPLGVTTDDFSFVGENYYISPSLETLSNMSLLELRKVENLVIGHQLYGKIEFLEPVDLSTIPPALLCGKYVVFSSEKCSVFANSVENAAPNAGINVSSRITCLHCFPLNKENRQPIKDPNHHLVKRHIEKLKKKHLTRFEKYNPVTGDYTFTVHHPIIN